MGSMKLLGKIMKLDEGDHKDIGLELSINIRAATEHSYGVNRGPDPMCR